jgi:IclR family transcriptional regulator, acetate operon repressor
MPSPIGSIARNPTRPALPRGVPTETAVVPALESAPPSGPMARWVRVLEAFAESGEWGIRDLARATEIPRSAAHRILHEMAALGLLAPADEPGRFRVGADLARIGLRVAEHLDIRRVGRPFLERASAAIGETVVLAVYDPGRRQFSAVDAVETSHPIRYLWESLRDWSDLHLGSSGKGILAFLPPDEQDAIIDPLPDPIPGRTPLAKRRLRDDLAAARRRGYVVSHGERYEGAVGVSAPVRDAAGRVVGDLIATWPDNRTGADKEAAAGIIVRAAADDLSRRLGWAGPHPVGRTSDAPERGRT